MTVYVLQNVRDARILARYYQMDVPAGQGRFPIKRLQAVAEANGDSIVIKDWDSSATSTIGQQRYHVTALVQQGHNTVPRAVDIELQAVRDWARLQNRRGKVSFETIGRAALALNHWSKAEIVSVDRIE